MSIDLNTLAADLEALAVDSNLPATETAIRAMAQSPNIANALALAMRIEGDPAALKLLEDLTPDRLAILAKIRALLSKLRPQ